MPPPAASLKQQRVQNALRDKEKILWLGRPVAASIPHTHRIIGLLGSLLLGLLGFHFALSPQSPLKTTHPDQHIPAILTLLLLISIALTLIRIPWKHMRTLQNTLYLLTNQRIAILHPQKKHRDQTIPLSAIDTIKHRPTSKTIGHLTIIPKKQNQATKKTAAKQTPLPPLQLKFLRNPENILERIHNKAKQPFR